jgi:D-alanine-D-alanine ligase
MSTALPSILVLGGGPDSEREVSLMSSRGVSEALQSRGHTVHYQIIDRLDAAGLAALPGEVIFPVLHGGWGEGGQLQDLLRRDGRPFVGCHAPAARIAMDKMATKLYAAKLGILTADAAIVNPDDTGIVFEAPAVFKPVHEGSSVGLHVCKDPETLCAALTKVRADIAAHPRRVYMLERAILGGRELTVAILDGQPLPIVEIKPASGVYDYEAKYFRDDTDYVVGPSLPGDPQISQRIKLAAQALFKAIGARHIARIDFILAPDGTPYLLEANTMPGFTTHSLVPKAAASTGINYAALCEILVGYAVRDR